MPEEGGRPHSGLFSHKSEQGEFSGENCYG
jgi:hypothetical protein